MTAVVLGWAEAIESSSLGEIVRQSTWAFALAEVVHLLGLTLVLGTTVVANLRLLGVGLREQPPSQLAADLRTWTLIGLAIAFASGLVLTISEPVKLVGSPPFFVKMFLLAVALVYSFAVHRRVTRSPPTVSRWMKVSGVVLLLLWFGVAAAGRVIAFY